MTRIRQTLGKQRGRGREWRREMLVWRKLIINPNLIEIELAPVVGRWAK